MWRENSYSSVSVGIFVTELISPVFLMEVFSIESASDSLRSSTEVSALLLLLSPLNASKSVAIFVPILAAISADSSLSAIKYSATEYFDRGANIPIFGTESRIPSRLLLCRTIEKIGPDADR
ncbi:ORF961 [White spot syndrome virus]|uniref:ORF961 n=1 Tax=White spot syndrome virus TaxID=342409 RepID=A0A2D3I5A3_9VIRU|nr:ORF961 [White spot syndrome virus]